MSRKSPVKMTDEQVLSVFNLSASGMTAAAIANRYKCSAGYVGRILKRQTHKEVRIPSDLLRAAAKAPKKRGKVAHLKRNRAAAAVNGAGRAEALSRYVQACYALSDAEERCLEHAVEPEVLASLLNVVSGDRHI